MAGFRHHWAVPGFFDRLRQASRARRSLLCVGLDPDPLRIPGGAAGALRHCLDVVERTAEQACCYKPNAAFWEQYGPDGWRDVMRRLYPSGNIAQMYPRGWHDVMMDITTRDEILAEMGGIEKAVAD